MPISSFLLRQANDGRRMVPYLEMQPDGVVVVEQSVSVERLR